MSNEPNPLETRSLPGAFWEKVPKNIAETDENIRAWFASHVDGSISPWREVRWLTENNLGIGLSISVFAALFIYLKLKNRKTKISLRDFMYEQLSLVFIFVCLGGMSNLISVVLKRLVGRLKPHVNWWDKAAPLPALSFPSSHAFNTAFLLTLAWLLQNKESRKKWRGYFVAVAVATFVIGLSRVVFTQHYPLDVLSGWILGAATARLFRPFVEKVFQRIS